MLRLTIFWLAIAFFISLFAGLILFSLFSLEFRKSSYGNDLYLYLIFLVPIALLLTMAGTVKKKNSKNKNWGIAGLTFFLAISVFVVMFSLLMQVSFGAGQMKKFYTEILKTKIFQLTSKFGMLVR